jgi:hypothetical protein
MTIKIINLDNLYYVYKESLISYYDKYFFHGNGHLLNFKNAPITLFAIDYVKIGKKVLNNLDSHIFIKYEYDRYSDAESVLNNTHKYKAAQRIIDIVDSIRKYGYCCGIYDTNKHLIRVKNGFFSSYGNEPTAYGNDPNGFTLYTRKHRAAACIALGIKEVRVKVV